MSLTARCAELLTENQTRWSASHLAMAKRAFYSTLARSILAGELDEETILARACATLGRRWRWLGPLVRRFLKTCDRDARPRHRVVAAFLAADAGLRAALARYGDEIRIASWGPSRYKMQPVSAARGWSVPSIESIGDLASWLEIRPEELQWFAYPRRFRACTTSEDRRQLLSHYTYRVLAKDQGSVRLIEAPKPRLKAIQTRILSGILESIPIHSAVHGFVRGRSIQSFAAPHVGKSVVLRLDLTDFFPSINRARVQAVFRMAGYPEPVADILGCLCTNVAPRRIWNQPGLLLDSNQMSAARQLYEPPHLPQGAPTSPAISNICAYRVDCRLAGLARSAGVTYTRYADDLAFSGEEAFGSSAERFAHHVAAILLEAGFRVHHRKTRLMRRGVRQSLAGLVVNHHLNVPRCDVDRLKAILTNCVRHGPESQNHEGHPAFRLHLEGRVGFVETVNPAAGARLRRMFDRIAW